MGIGDEADIGLTQLQGGDTSLWTKTSRVCVLCGGGVWILTAHFQQILRARHKLVACEGCGQHGSCYDVMRMDTIRESTGSPAESCP